MQRLDVTVHTAAKCLYTEHELCNNETAILLLTDSRSARQRKPQRSEFVAAATMSSTYSLQTQAYTVARTKKMNNEEQTTKPHNVYTNSRTRLN